MNFIVPLWNTSQSHQVFAMKETQAMSQMLQSRVRQQHSSFHSFVNGKRLKKENQQKTEIVQGSQFILIFEHFPVARAVIYMKPSTCHELSVLTSSKQVNTDLL